MGWSYLVFVVGLMDGFERYPIFMSHFIIFFPWFELYEGKKQRILVGI
jgi:hypothetical protein